MPCCLPFGKAGEFQILCCQRFAVNDYNFTPDALALKPSGFCNKGYSDWIIRFVKFQGYQKHPKDIGKSEIEAFLSHLATNRKVAASTQRQALNALVFLYKHVLNKPVGDNIAPVKAKKRRRPPAVMTKAEVRQVLNQMIKPCFFTRPLIFIT